MWQTWTPPFCLGVTPYCTKVQYCCTSVLMYGTAVLLYCCTVLFCVVLYCTLLYCTMLLFYCTVLNCSVVHCILVSASESWVGTCTRSMGVHNSRAPTKKRSFCDDCMAVYPREPSMRSCPTRTCLHTIKERRSTIRSCHGNNKKYLKYSSMWSHTLKQHNIPV